MVMDPDDGLPVLHATLIGLHQEQFGRERAASSLEAYTLQAVGSAL
jgi:hypothetical protein